MRVGILLLGLVTLLSLAGCGGGSGGTGGGGGAEGGKELVIVWAQWEPADALAKLCEKYTKETGTKVRVEQIPWASFSQKVQTAIWAGKSADYDLIIGDSQWLGQGATEGHYVELTDWLKTATKMEDLSPAALSYYGEYPAESKKYYGIPCESDGIGFVYRKDWFDDPKEQTAFQAKHGHKLEPPKTWDDLKQIAEFFTRPAKGQYGLAPFYSKEYDCVTMGYEQVLWCWGGDWTNDKGEPDGAINSPTAIQALDFYKSLKPFCPPGSEGYYITETGQAFNGGKVAMAMQWYAFMPQFADKKRNPHADTTGYFVSPGEKKHYVALGGQGMSLSSYSKQQDEAKKFMQWFLKEDTQREWAKLGGYTANNKVLASDDFKKAAPYNDAFSQTVPLLKDFTNKPMYQEMLIASQNHLNAAITGQETSKAALDAIAQAHTKALASSSSAKK